VRQWLTWSRGTVALLAALAVMSRLTLHAQDSGTSQREYNVKAVSLYAFGRYVTWPDSAYESADSPVVIGVLGGNPFGDALDQIAAKKTLNGRPIAIRQLTSPDEVAACHIVFVSKTVPSDAESKVVQAASGKPVLLVGESPGFAQRGGIINFYQSGPNVRFELNPERGQASHLSLSAKLLSLGAKAPTQ
jgi:hypothetical protein